MLNLKKHSVAPLGYFFIVSLLGILLRFFFVTPISLNYENILHTHSHVALLGWLYLGLSLLIYKVFLKNSKPSKIHNWIFLSTNISFLGMLISFPIQGYGFFSIAFSTHYLLNTYWFSWFIIKYIPKKLKSKFSWKLIKTGLFYLILSSLGTLAIAPISATVGLDSFWFNDAIYFFLHFLYSGFFFLTLLGVLFRILEKKKIVFSANRRDRFYVVLNTGIILSYFLSVLWKKPPAIFYLLGIIGGIYQFYGFYLFFKLLKPKKKVLKEIFSSYAYFLMKFAGVLLIIRVIMQLISGIPYFANLAFEFKDFVIGYLHLVFLGIVTPMLLVFLSYFKMLKFAKQNINLFLFTFISTEILIFYNAFSFWLKLPQISFFYYYRILAVLSCLFPVAIAWLLLKNMKLAFLDKK